MGQNASQHIAVAVVIQRNNRLLMVEEGKEGIRGLWNLPSGHVEPGESIIAAAIRETREETGLDIAPASILGIENYVVANGSQYVKFVLLAGTSEQAADTLHVDGAEILSARWVPVDEIKSMAGKLRKPDTMALALERLANGATYPLALLKDYL